MAKVDRSTTPWLVATWHPPWYSTYEAHYREAECMRIEMEELLYSYGVDIVFNGHVSCGFLMHQVLIETTTFYIMTSENHGIM